MANFPNSIFSPRVLVDRIGKVVAVKSDVSGLEFITPSVGAVDFVDLGDVPASYADQAGKVVAVNADEDALEFIAPPAGGSLYTIPISSANTTTLADSSTYYGGFVSALTFGSNNSNRGFRVPIAGTINKISVDWISTATASTNEEISIYI
jgi:hypothetical protein